MNNFSPSNLIPEFSAIMTEGVMSSNGLSASVVLFLILLSVAFFIYAFIKFWGAMSTTKKYNALVNSIEPKTLFAQRLDIKEKAAKQFNDNGKLWREFDESLVNVFSHNESRLYNSIDAAHFFNPSSLSGTLTENRLLAAVPGFITAFGVIGTFAGLTLGLKGIDLGSQDISELRSGIEHMINGASVAFITSLWGVLLSVVFNASEKALERIVRKRIKRLQNTIDYLYPRITAEQSLADIETQQVKSNKILQGLAEEIGNQMQAQMSMVSNNLRAGLEESLERILAPALEKLAVDAHEGSANALESLMDRYMERIGDIGTSQREMLETVSTSLNGASEEMSEGMRSIIKDFKHQMDGVSDAQKTVLNAVSSKIDQSTTRMDESLHGVINQFESSLTAASGSQKAMMDSVTDDFSTVSSDLDKGLKSFVSDLSQQMDKSAAIQNNILKNVESTSASHHESFAKIQENLTSLVTSFDEVVKENHSAAKQFKLSGDMIFRSGENFSMFANKIDGSVTSMTETFGQLVQTAQKLTEENREIGSILTNLIQSTDAAIASISQCSDKLAQLGQMTTQELGAVKTHFEQLQITLKNHVKELEQQMTHLLQQYGEQVQAQTSERMNEWNIQTSNYTGTMKDAISALAGVVDEMENKEVVS